MCIGISERREVKIKLLAITQDSEELIEYAGRVCWRTGLSLTQAGTVGFIKALIERGHLSVIEHPSATFEISGISRACTHQLVRHRIASYSQESQRYVDMSDPEFVVPPAITEHIGTRLIWDRFVTQVGVAYGALLAGGIRKEDARFVLPNATLTRIVVTMNFRQWRHFFKMRCDKHAQWEIRKVAKTILAILYLEAPAVFEDLYEVFLGQ